MQTHTITTYTYDELTDDARDRAFTDWQEGVDSDPYGPPWQDEIRQSVQGAIESAGLTLSDWSIGRANPADSSIGTYTYSWIKVNGWNGEIAGDVDAGDLHGARALAWLENNMLAHNRIPWQGEQRTSVAKYGAWYRPGKVKPCPFTGYYLDDVIIDHLINRVAKCGDTLLEAFESLASVWQSALEDEEESARSREYFEDTWAHEQEYLADGSVYDARISSIAG